jgi:hypothetical protein
MITGSVRRAAPLLRAAGYEVSEQRTAAQKTITISRIEEPSPSSRPSSPEQDSPGNDDPDGSDGSGGDRG